MCECVKMQEGYVFVTELHVYMSVHNSYMCVHEAKNSNNNSTSTRAS